MELIEVVPHEFVANFIYSDHGLAPWFGADRCVKDGGGSVVTDFETDGERWRAKLYYQQSGIVHPGMTTPQGMPVELEKIREFRIAVERHSKEDSVGKQRFNARIAPRWQGMKVENKQGQVSELSIPNQLIEGMNARVSGANIQFDRYQPLLCEAAEAVASTRGTSPNPTPSSPTSSTPSIRPDRQERERSNRQPSRSDRVDGSSPQGRPRQRNSRENAP